MLENNYIFGPSERTKKLQFCFNKSIPSCCNGSASFLKIFRVLQGWGSKRGQLECDLVVISSSSSQQGIYFVQAPNRTGPGSLPRPANQSDPVEGEPGASGGSGSRRQQSQACELLWFTSPRQRPFHGLSPREGKSEHQGAVLFFPCGAAFLSLSGVSSGSLD